jgi:hypothetical protein
MSARCGASVNMSLVINIHTVSNTDLNGFISHDKSVEFDWLTLGYPKTVQYQFNRVVGNMKR